MQFGKNFQNTSCSANSWLTTLETNWGLVLNLKYEDSYIEMVHNMKEYVRISSLGNFEKVWKKIYK